MVYNKSTILYSNGPKKSPKCCKTLVGKQMPIGIGRSQYASASPTGVKISNAAFYLDKFFVERNYFGYSNQTDKVIVLEYEGNILYTNGDEMRSIKSASSDMVMMADILWDMECNDNEELKALFQTFSKSKIPFKEADVAKFCDSYFYHRARKEYTVTCNENLILGEVEASVRSGYLKPAHILKGIKDLPESVLKQVKVVETPEVEDKKVELVVSKDAFLESCKKGDYVIKHQWTEEQKALVPPLSFLDDMVSNVTFQKLVQKIKFRTDRVIPRMQDEPYADDDVKRINALGRDFINVTLVGKPGTGKSHNVHSAAAACGLPIYVVNCSQNMDEDRIEGMTKIVDGKPVAIPTEAVKCFRDGGILLFEEANLPQAAVIMGAAGQAVEYPFILKQDGYHDIRRHPLCIVVTTMNVGTAGTKTIAQQFANRFKTSYVMDDPERKEFIQRLINASGESESLCSWIYDCYERVTECIREDNAQADIDSILNSLSVRTCIGAIENIQEGSSPKEAIYDSIIGKIYEQDAEVAANCKSVIDIMVDYKSSLGRGKRT